MLLVFAKEINIGFLEGLGPWLVACMGSVRLGMAGLQPRAALLLGEACEAIVAGKTRLSSAL